MKQFIIITAIALAIMLTGCATHQPFPEGGEETSQPIGYTFHCISNPDSIFCKDRSDR